MNKVFKVKVITNAKKELVTKSLESSYKYKVKISAVPEKGKANKRLVIVLADFLKINRSNVEIVSGFQSNIKTISITENVRKKT